MSSSYSLYHMSAFPKVLPGETICAPKQIAIVFGEQKVNTPPRTEFTLIRKIDSMNIDVFECLHEQRVEEVGRIDDLEFTSYIKRTKFLAYFHSNTKLFMMNVAKEIASSAFSKMTGSDNFRGRRRGVNLKEIENQVQRFTGMYASVDNSVGVHSQALFGKNINTDPMYARALKEGSMYYVIFDYVIRTNSMLQEASMSFSIGKDSTFVITQEGIPENLELEIVLHINNHLLESASY
jgi:hypothetical protein